MEDTFICSGKGLSQFVSVMNKPIGLEIGCETGKTTKHLLDCNPDLKLYSIDPYKSYEDWNGVFLNRMETLKQETLSMLQPYSQRFKLLNSTSDYAVKFFFNETFDFIFIDGLHTYDQVSKDCENYYDKLKPGGIFSGHDYTAIEGVNKAVVEFAARVGKEISTTENDVWYWVK